MIRTATNSFVFVAALLALCVPASAATVYQYTFDQTLYFAAPGQNVSVSVYLQETVTGASVAVLGPSGVGMFSGGTAVFANDGNTATDPAEVLAMSGIQPNAGFADLFSIQKALLPAPAFTAAIADLNSELYGVNTGPGVYRLLLGTFNFTAGLVPGENTTLRATERPAGPTVDDNVTMLGASLDSQIAQGFASIQVIPEPSSVILAVLACGGLATVAWRRRRNSIAA